MKRRTLTTGLAGIAAIVIAGTAAAQTTMDWPMGDIRPYVADSALVENASPTPAVVFSTTVELKDAAWLRLYFKRVELAPGSVVRMTSLHDGEVQTLDRDGLAMWGNTSAYFNGGRVLLELVAAPKSANRLVLGHVAAQRGQADAGGCGICDGDDRLPSDADFAGRLAPGGCSATVWNRESCVVTAGHCVGGNDVVQFRVPPSNNDCTTSQPPVDDQFPIIEAVFRNDGPGRDWATLRLGTNGPGERPYDRYGRFVPIATAPVPVGSTAEVWGYGVDQECDRSQVQQHSTGTINVLASNLYQHDVDTTFGNSGSGLHHDGRIIGIVTHCGCPNNTATRVGNDDFRIARATMCPCDGDANADGTIDFTDILKVLAQWGSTGGSADVNHDGIVDFRDILYVLGRWGAC